MEQPSETPDFPGCLFCEGEVLRSASIFIETRWCIYAASRDQKDPPDVLPGSGIIVPKAHRASAFDSTPSEWQDTRELLLRAKRRQDAQLNPDSYLLSWSPFPSRDEDVAAMHSHLDVVPRFDDEPRAQGGGRTPIQGADNRRADPLAPGSGRALLFGLPVVMKADDRVLHHEAGHAVASFKLGDTPAKISVIPDETSPGPVDYHGEPETPERAQRRIIAFSAGPAAETKHLREEHVPIDNRLWQGAPQDEEASRTLARDYLLAQTPTQVTSYLVWLRTWANETVEEQWSRVGARDGSTGHSGTDRR